MEQSTMDSFKIYTQGDILALTNLRDGEQKLGEQVQIYPHYEERNNQTISLESLKQSTARFVLLGIPEDVGVRANLGIAGAKTTWNPALKAILNTQSNSFLNGKDLLVLGHFEISEPDDQSIDNLRKKVKEIDLLVSFVIEKIIAAGKIPIIVGGGHNNAAPIIAGASKALNQLLNVVNIDAHADLRSTKEGRHSGNGFSFALEQGYLNQYLVFGLQENYVNQSLATYLSTKTNIKTLYFEDLLQSSKSILENWKDFTKDLVKPCGLEIDLDTIENVLSSAITPSGFALNDIRKILLSNDLNFSYLHICEGVTELADGRKDLTTGKTIAYLVTDFIKALLLRTSPQL